VYVMPYAPHVSTWTFRLYAVFREAIKPLQEESICMTWDELWDEKKYDILDKIRRATPQRPGTKTKKGLCLEELANFVDLHPRDAVEFLEYIQERGANIFIKDNHVFTRGILPVTRWTHEDIIPQSSFEVFGQKVKGYRFGVVSDTHFGSNRTNMTVLSKAYEHFANEGIKHVLHVGNILAGRGTGKHAEADRVSRDLETQLDLFLHHYPEEEITTYFILGDADCTYAKQNTNPAMTITNERPDFVYLGNIEADLIFHPKGKKPFRLRLYNEKLVYSYGVSYHAQRKLENLAGGDRPNIWLIGGTQQVWSSRYQGVEIRKLPGMQHQTLQMRDRAYPCNVGFNVVSITCTKERPELYTHLYSDMNPGPTPAIAQKRAA